MKFKLHNHLFLKTVLTLCLFSSMGKAQTTVSGKVISNKKLPIAGVNVLIKDSYDGATSDKEGNFSFVSADTGKFILHAALLGYIDFDQEIHLTGKEIKLDILLFGADVELQAVTISAGMIEASDEKKATVLKPLDIVTTAGGQGDIVGALKTLPGAQQVGEGSGLFVRGGTNNETKTLIDGMIVNNPFYNGAQDVAQRGRFSPFLFKGTVFSTGGYSAQYGQALSSVLALESVDLPDRGSSSVGISPLGITLGTNRLAGKGKFSYGGDVNYFNVGLYNSVVKQSFDWKRSAQLAGGSFNFRKRFAETGILKFYTYFNYSDMATLRQNIDSVNVYKDLFDLNNLNIFSILTYKEKLGNKWLLNAGASYSYNKDNIKINKDTISGQNEMLQGRAMLSRSIFRSSIFRMGAEHQYVPDQGSYNKYKRAMFENYTSAFAEADIYFFNRLVLRLGERYEYSQWLRKGVFAYRGSVAFKLSKNSQLSYAQGDFYQKPDRDFLWNDHSQQFQKATHYVLNWQYVTDSITFRAEVFYKKYNNLTSYTPYLNSQYYSGLPLSPDTINNGNGYATGFELFWRDKKTFKNIDYWISYSYLDTKRQFNNYPENVQPTFAANHTASLVFKKFFKKGIATGLTYIYASGRPYYNPNNPFFLGDRTIDYHTLGLNVSYIRQIGKAFCVFVFSVTNVIGNDQVFSYKYSYDGVRRQEVGLPAPRSFFFGIFLSFGVDRTKDIINNNT